MPEFYMIFTRKMPESNIMTIARKNISYPRLLYAYATQSSLYESEARGRYTVESRDQQAREWKNKNMLQIVINQISPRALFSTILKLHFTDQKYGIRSADPEKPTIERNLMQIGRPECMTIRNFPRRPAAILDVVQPKLAPFDPLISKTLRQNLT